MIANYLKNRLKLLSIAVVFALSLFEANIVKAATVEKIGQFTRQKQSKIKLKLSQKQSHKPNLLLTKVLLNQKSKRSAASSGVPETKIASLNLEVPLSNDNNNADNLSSETAESVFVPQKFQLAQVASGKASWYGPKFHGRPTASGEKFNQNALTAAHRHLPFGTRVKVTNVDNGRSVVVRINDRGPFIGGRIIDLSAAAADTLGLVQSGVAPVRLQILGR